MGIDLNKDHSIKASFNRYLALCGLNPLKMNRVQFVEMRKSFAAGYGVALAAMIKASDKDEESAIKMIDAMVDDSKEFWDKEKREHNEKGN